MRTTGPHPTQLDDADDAWPGTTTPGWDDVDEASWESFPASDPPSSHGASQVGARPPTHPVLTAVEIDALLEALDDEHRAWATYDQVIHDFGPVRPFINIRDAEGRHIGALQVLFRRYGLAIPANPWLGRVDRYASLHEACLAGIDAELANAALYDRLLASTRRADILGVYQNLQRASQERHLWAFRRCAARRGRGR